MSASKEQEEGLGARAAHELKSYAIVSGYLFVCFVVIGLYADSLQPSTEPWPLSWSLAVGKALLVGKFILIGEAMKVGKRAGGFPLLHRIVWKSLLFLPFLLVLQILEELIVGAFKDRSVAETFAELFGGPWLNLVAPWLLILLILFPLIATTEVRNAMGAERFRELWLGQDSD